MKQNKRPEEEESIIPDRNYITCFICGFVFGAFVMLFIVTLVKGVNLIG